MRQRASTATRRPLPSPPRPFSSSRRTSRRVPQGEPSRTPGAANVVVAARQNGSGLTCASPFSFRRRAMPMPPTPSCRRSCPSPTTATARLRPTLRATVGIGDRRRREKGRDAVVLKQQLPSKGIYRRMRASCPRFRGPHSPRARHCPLPPLSFLLPPGHDCGGDNCTVIETDYYFIETLRRLQGAPF